MKVLFNVPETTLSNGSFLPSDVTLVPCEDHPGVGCRWAFWPCDNRIVWCTFLQKLLRPWRQSCRLSVKRWRRLVGQDASPASCVAQQSPPSRCWPSVSMDKCKVPEPYPRGSLFTSLLCCRQTSDDFRSPYRTWSRLWILLWRTSPEVVEGWKEEKSEFTSGTLNAPVLPQWIRCLNTTSINR